MNFNISAFDIFSAPAPSGQGGDGAEGSSDLTVWVGAGVPSAVLVVTVLILLRQNLDRVLQLCAQCTKLYDSAVSLADSLKTWTTRRRERPQADVPTVVVAVPRNLTDSEMMAMRPPAHGRQWI